jgi:hypothetical protein
MSLRSWIGSLAIGVLGVSAVSAARASDDGDDTPFVETIYNFRSERVSRSVPTAFCDPMNAPALFEDLFDMYSYETRAKDGRVVKTATRKVGTIRVCLGVKSNPPLVLNFYAEFHFAGLEVIGLGVCTQQFANFPAPGTTFFVCNQSLSSPGYVGGMLVTSSANGPAAIEPNDPNLFGFHETSFATVRLWRERQADNVDDD